jgi:hypothetical protein
MLLKVAMFLLPSLVLLGRLRYQLIQVKIVSSLLARPIKTNKVSSTLAQVAVLTLRNMPSRIVIHT